MSILPLPDSGKASVMRINAFSGDDIQIRGSRFRIAVHTCHACVAGTAERAECGALVADVSTGVYEEVSVLSTGCVAETPCAPSGAVCGGHAGGSWAPSNSFISPAVTLMSAHRRMQYTPKTDLCNCSGLWAGNSRFICLWIIHHVYFICNHCCSTQAVKRVGSNNIHNA